MDAELPSRAASQLARNPFRRSRIERSLKYSLGEESKTITTNTYHIYEAIFEKSCSEPYFIPDEAAIKVLQSAALDDKTLEDLWDEALSATYESSSLVEPKEGFLNRDEFFILLAGLQRKIGLDDETFETKFSDSKDSYLAQRSSSLVPPIELDAGSTLRITSCIPSIDEDTEKEVVQNDMEYNLHVIKESGTPENDNQIYADGFTEYTSAFQYFDPLALPRFDKAEKEVAHDLRSINFGESSQPEAMNPSDSSSHWTCSTCTLHNPSEFLICDACATERPAEASSALMEASNEKISMNQAPFAGNNDLFALQHIEPAEKIYNPPRRSPSVAASIKSTQSSSTAFRIPRKSIQNTNPYLSSSVYEMESSITTPASDAQALFLATASEPKKSAFSVKGLRRSIIQRSTEKLDQTANGLSLRALSTVLQNAATSGDLPLLASTLKLGADVNYSSRKDKELHHALSRAATSNHGHIVDHLLRMGANIDSASFALFSAIKKNYTGMAMKLVPRADINKMWQSDLLKDLTCNVYESCVCAIAGMDNASRQQMLRLIMEQPGFDPESSAMIFAANPDELSSPKSCVMTILGCFAAFTDLAGVEFLLQQFGNQYRIPRRPDGAGASSYRDPLSCINSAYWQEEPADALKMATLLLQHGAQSRANATIPGGKGSGWSPLALAIMGGSINGVRLLLSHGSDPECSMYTPGNHPNDDLTPLSYAAIRGEAAICRALVDHGATPYRADQYRRTPLYYACIGGQIETTRYFLSMDINRSNIQDCLQASLVSNAPEVARMLVEVGATVSTQAWEHAMSVQRTGKDRLAYIEVIDLFLSTPSPFPRTAILKAIDTKNFAGLSRVLEMRHADLSFNVHEIFANERWSNVPIVVKDLDTAFRDDMRVRRWDLQNCLAYAEEKGADDFVALLKSYGWSSRAECEARCTAKKASLACDSNPPHKLHAVRRLAVAGVLR